MTIPSETTIAHHITTIIQFLNSRFQAWEPVRVANERSLDALRIADEKLKDLENDPFNPKAFQTLKTTLDTLSETENQSSSIRQEMSSLHWREWLDQLIDDIPIPPEGNTLHHIIHALQDSKWPFVSDGLDPVPRYVKHRIKDIAKRMETIRQMKPKGTG